MSAQCSPVICSMATTASPTSYSSTSRLERCAADERLLGLVLGDAEPLGLQPEVPLHPLAAHRPGRQAVDADTRPVRPRRQGWSSAR